MNGCSFSPAVTVGDFGSRQDGLIASREERGHFPTIQSLMKATGLGLQAGAFRNCLSQAEHVCVFLGGEPRLTGF